MGTSPRAASPLQRLFCIATSSCQSGGLRMVCDTHNIPDIWFPHDDNPKAEHFSLEKYQLINMHLHLKRANSGQLETRYGIFFSQKNWMISKTDINMQYNNTECTRLMVTVSWDRLWMDGQMDGCLK